MAATFPGGVKSFTTKVDGVDDVMAVDVNGIQDEVVALETYALQHNGSGTSFPASPSVGDVFFRTDLALSFFYNGSLWLSTSEFSVCTSNAVVSSGGVNYPIILPLRTDLLTYITRCVILTNVLTTNDISNYWNINVRTSQLSFAPAYTDIYAFSTSADSAGVLTSYESVPSIAEAGATNKYWLFLQTTKVGSPGNLNTYATIFYRVIGS